MSALAVHLSAFLREHLPIERRASIHTCETYAYAFQLLVCFTKATRAVLRAWLREPQRGEDKLLFPNARGGRLTVHGVQYLLNKHRRVAADTCSSLKQKRVTVHRLRHTVAVDLLREGVDRS